MVAVEFGKDNVEQLIGLVESLEEMVGLTEDELEFLVSEAVLTELLLEVESLKSDFSRVSENEWSKLLELDVFIVVGIVTEHVPENVLQLFRSCLMQHLSY
jgi:hypothetical protein